MSHSLKTCLPFVLLCAVMTFLVRNNFYFWDTVQFGSLHAHFYFENNFNQFILPPEMDSGHPPFFGMYIAALWKLFGRSLWVSHFAMLPFLIGNIFLFYELGKHFLGTEKAFWVPLLFFFDPVYIGQAVMVSPDIVLVFFFLMALLGVLKEDGILKMLGLFGLAAISTRGMMCMVVIFLLDFFLNIIKQPLKNTLKAIPLYLPAAFLGFGFLLYHYKMTGWLGFHPGSSWAPAFERVGPQGLLKNIGVLGWRMLDFGRVFLWLAFALSLWYAKINRVKFSKQWVQLIMLLFLCFLMLTPSFLLYKNLNGHRYLLPLMLSFNLIVLFAIHELILKEKIRNILFVSAFAALLTGNFWVYPDYISQGWDSTLAHLPYYKMRDNMVLFMKDHKIPKAKTGTCFPNKLSEKYIDLKESTEQFAAKNLAKNDFFFYSNVFNDLNEEELLELATKWKVVKEFKNMNIRVILFKRE